MKYIRDILVASVVISAGAAPALAQSSETELPRVLLRPMSQYVESYVSQVMQPFRRAAGEDQILTADEVERLLDTARAMTRGSFMTAFFAADLDGDLRVTSEEWQAVANNPLQQGKKDRRRWDADGDGITTVEEAYALSKRQNMMEVYSRNGGELGGYMSLAAARDGALTASELKQAALAAFAGYDSDGDGVLSQEDQDRLRLDKRRLDQQAIQEAQFAACDLPKPGAGQKVLFLSGHEGAALSTVAVAGLNRETTTAEIRIEPGAQPLFIMTKTEGAMIWRVTGAVERVASFVALSDSDDVGVVGLAKGKVAFPAGAGCLPRIGRQNEVNQGMLGSLGKVLGRTVDGAYATFQLSTVTLPSQAMAPDVWKFDQTLGEVEFSYGPLKPLENSATEQLQRYRRGGVVEIEAKDVVAYGAVEPYELLPKQAGLAQLMERGDVTYEEGLGYIVRRPIPSFPPGINGSHGIAFVLADGVPRPAGMPGHSRVLTYSQAIELRDRRSQRQRPHPTGQQYQITR